MSTTTLVIALASFVASSALESPSWHVDYCSAQRLGRERSKPLAVFIGSGKAGWNQISRDGPLGKDVKRLLAKDYICVYVDTDLEAGKQLASEFEVPEGLGLIVSDHSGKYQAFRHQGDLPSEQLVRYLSRYADPERMVRTTATNSPEGVSYSPPETYPVAVEPYRLLRSSPMFSGGGGRSC
jgi:hypothetical protein